MDRETIGSSRTYGLSFQSAANQKITDAEEKRKQTLVEQATKNGYLLGQNTKRAQDFRNTVNQKLERAISSGKSPSEAREDEQQRIALDRQIKALDNELAPLKNKIEGRYPAVSEKSGKTKEALTEERSKLIRKKKDVTGDYGVLDSIYNSLEAGAGQFNSGVTSTLRTVAKKGADVLRAIESFTNSRVDKKTGEIYLGDTPITDSLFHTIEDVDSATKDTTAQFAQRAATGWNQYGKGGNLANQLIQGTVSAVPNAVLAMATAGGSTAATFAPEASGLAATVASSVQKLAKNPMYWTSFVQSFGNSYDEAIEKGATEDEALLATLLSSTVNAVVEVGGGVEQLPGELREAGLTSKDKIRKWVSSSLDEGKEEVVQGMIERLVNKAVYDQDAPWSDDTGKNEDAVFNLRQSLQEGAMGAAIGGILGGGQMLAQDIATRGQRIVDPTASPLDQAILDTLQGVQTPENVTQVREPTELDNIIMETQMQLQSGISPEVATNKPKDVKNLLNATKEQISRFIQNAFNKQNQYTSENVWKQAVDNAKASIPGLRETLPAKKDVWGNDVKNEGGFRNFMNRNINPGDVTTYRTDAVSSELDKISEESGESLYPQRYAPRSIKVGDEDVKLTDAQRDTYQETYDEQELVEGCGYPRGENGVPDGDCNDRHVGAVG